MSYPSRIWVGLSYTIYASSISRNELVNDFLNFYSRVA